MKRIVRSILMSAALVFGVTGCPPERPDDGDAGIGGSAPTGGTTATGGRATGGTATGGTSTGGTPPVLCSTVAALPEMGTTCTTSGESRCDPNGNLCQCIRGIWVCDTSCAAEYPNPPALGSACRRGQACGYPSGTSCICPTNTLKWACVGIDGCPATLPTTGSACDDNLAGLACDYPNSNHMGCLCTAGTTSSTWSCISFATCPPTQPSYDLAGTCPGLSFCTYGTTHCSCMTTGTPWLCGFAAVLSLVGVGPS
jgi:hypothetical protein